MALKAPSHSLENYWCDWEIGDSREEDLKPADGLVYLGCGVQERGEWVGHRVGCKGLFARNPVGAKFHMRAKLSEECQTPHGRRAIPR